MAKTVSQTTGEHERDQSGGETFPRLKEDRSSGTVQGLLHAESACLRSLETITQGIGDALAANEIEGLEGELARRGEVIECMRDIERRLRPLLAAQGERDDTGLPEGAKDSDKVAKIKGQLESVLAYGKVIERLLVARRRELSGKITVLQKCRKMVASAAPAARRRLDIAT